MIAKLSHIFTILMIAFLCQPSLAGADPLLKSEADRTNVSANDSSYTPPVYVTNTGNAWAYHDTDVPQDWACCNASWIDRQFDATPLINGFTPSGPFATQACPSCGGDNEAVILDRRDPYGVNTKDFEMWGVHKNAAGAWTFRWGHSGPPASYVADHGMRYCPNGDCVQGSGISFIPGVILYRDLTAGAINHALGLVVPHGCATFVKPAIKSDGWNDSTCVQYGNRYKLPVGYNCAQFSKVLVSLICQTASSTDPNLAIIPTDQSGNGFSFRLENWKRELPPWAPSSYAYVNPYTDRAKQNILQCPASSDVWACTLDKTHLLSGITQVFNDLVLQP